MVGPGVPPRGPDSQLRSPAPALGAHCQAGVRVLFVMARGLLEECLALVISKGSKLSEDLRMTEPVRNQGGRRYPSIGAQVLSAEWSP